MALWRLQKTGKNPREFASEVLQHLELQGIAEKPEIAGPGFINIFLDQQWLATHLQQALNDKNLAVSAVEKQTIVVDYSSQCG